MISVALATTVILVFSLIFTEYLRSFSIRATVIFSLFDLSWRVRVIEVGTAWLY